MSTTPAALQSPPSGRRKLRFNSLDEVLADAEHLLRDGYRRSGNWTLGQVCNHLGAAVTVALAPTRSLQPWPVRFVAKHFVLPQVFREMKPGYQLRGKVAEEFLPPDTPDEQGVAMLREAFRRFQAETPRYPHPVFGKLTRAEWEKLTLRHSELHLSFLIPEKS
ncbi:MAG: DUF1569 domain-containing protein [Pirellulales bacterium]|nr:DUF1569 domain-containing protein [Pirellulales bacterium]